MNHINHRRSMRRLLAVTLAAAGIVVLWLISLNASFALPRIIQTFVLTTVADFTSGTAVRTGIVNNSGGEVALVPVGVTGVWITDTQQLPAARMELAVVSSGSHIFALGGIDNTSFPRRTVYSTTVVGGNLTPWVTQAYSLPIALSAMSAGVATAGGVNRVYILGGQAGAVPTDTVFYATLNDDGSVGAWTSNSAHLPVGLKFASAVVNRTYMYVLGGIDASNVFRQEVYRAPINGDGSLGTWVATSSLPQATALSAAVVYQGTYSDTIYVLGGATSSSSNTANVYFADVNPADGSLSAWTLSTGVLPQAFSSHAALQLNGQIFIIGGNAGQIGSTQPRNTVLSALVDESDPTRRLVDFGLGQSWAETEPLPIPRLYHGAALVNNEMFVVGGSDTGTAPSALAYHGPVGGAGSRYAPTGNYISPVTNVGGNFQLLDLAWSTVITDQTALTVTVRYHTSTNGINWFPYSALLPSSSATSLSLTDAKPITYPLDTFAQYFQYQVFFTTTNNAVTPFFTQSQLRALPAPPDLAVSLAAQANVVLPGNLITYTIIYSNLTGIAAGGVILTETVPSNTVFVGAGAGWSFAGQRNYTKMVGAMAPHSIANTYFVVRINDPPGASVVADVVSIGGDPNEFDFSNNTASVLTLVEPLSPGIDLRVSVDDGVASVSPGQVITYTISYENFGTSDAPGARLTETIPANTSYVGGPQWTPAGGNLFVHDIGTVASSDAASIDFPARINLGLSGNILFTDTVDIGTSGIDTNLSNNHAVDVDQLRPPGFVYLPIIRR